MRFSHVLVTGGAGYVGAELVPSLLRSGYRVTVLDWFLYREDLFAGADPRFLTIIKGDLRDRDTVRRALRGVDAVIHLACISNDPSAELDRKLTETVNQDAFAQLIDECERAEIGRFIFASSSSIYGISEAEQVFEDHPRVPVSAYNISKAWCEDLLEARYRDRLPYVVVRPATLCGYSRRQRLDLTVNILSAQAITRRSITIFGGSQYRPSLNLADCVRLYQFMLEADDSVIGQAFNASRGNFSINEIAEIIVRTLEPMVGLITITRSPTNDLRSYRVNTTKLASVGFAPELKIEDAVRDLLAAFATGILRPPIDQPQYLNVKRMMEKAVL
jgi:nucleoside-diphosphate-sugar epimerase